MPSRSKNDYDAIIIGAGIGGLVCGCYLAKAGMKVLIAEQHFKPGGYCTSFTRKGFTFDAAAHSLGGCKHGFFGRVLNDLKLNKKIEFVQFDPSETISTPDCHVSFWKQINKTVDEFQARFSEERHNIKSFFTSIINPSPQLLSQMRKMTFQNLLDHYFNDTILKSILAVPLFGYMGLPPSQIAAFLGMGIFKECILDGGYYPKRGMQSLSDAFAQIFEEYGGEILLSCRAKKIRVRENEVLGVYFEEKGFIPSKYVISNCDARQTFLKLLGKNIVPQDSLIKMRTMSPSLSTFVIYLGVDKHLSLPRNGTNTWVLSKNNLDGVYELANKGYYNKIGAYLLNVSYDENNIVASRFAPFKNINYWKYNKRKWEDYFISRLENDLIPELSQHIIYRSSATPQTLFKYTLNFRGAAYGWAGVPSQFAIPDFSRPSFLQGMYLTGHWTTRGLGIPGVTYIAYDTARLILRKEKKMSIIN